MLFLRPFNVPYSTPPTIVKMKLFVQGPLCHNDSTETFSLAGLSHETRTLGELGLRVRSTTTWHEDCQFVVVVCGDAIIFQRSLLEKTTMNNVFYV